MNNPSMEQLAAAQKANTEVMMSLMRTALTGIERLTALNMAATREFFNNTVANTQQLMAAKDANEIVKLNSKLAEPGVEKIVDYSRNVYDLVADMQKEITAVMEEQYNSFNQNASSVVAKARTAPVGGDVFAAGMESMLNASTKAFDSMSSIAKQLSGIAEANLQAATKVVTPAAKSSATSAAAKKATASK